MSQEKYFGSHRFVFVNGVLWEDCVKWPDFKKDMQTVEVANDEKYIFPVATGMNKLEPLEFEFNRTKSPNSAHWKGEEWIAAGDERQVTVIETDATADPFDPSCFVAVFDLGKCGIGPNNYPGGEKASPTAGKYVATILPRRIAYKLR
ncbi:hypothetical protein [Leptospira andrefontaineae]|uniref:Uncharacterized protein n=1 Tax=Leptospira andrefontaineae TaxID=2484976 RepID=A0A4V3JFB1_9LEPT|nr:hypothetical protein [Leptospira andrefontaineae]TGK36282.1 hypothetical protein EHO65_18450 [Leptospira andrefontaineae]